MKMFHERFAKQHHQMQETPYSFFRFEKQLSKNNTRLPQNSIHVCAILEVADGAFLLPTDSFQFYAF